MDRGVVYALSAYFFWGLHPIYWKQLQNISPFEILSHRIIWSLTFFIIIISARKQWRGLLLKIQKNPNKISLFIPAFLIGSNWGVYIWAVNSGYIIETSLGYFICPLISVFLGVVILGERMSLVRWISIGIAVTGVLSMTFFYGQFPWLSLYLAGSWGLYGLAKKKSPLTSVEGLTLETIVMLIPALIYLAFIIPENTFSIINNPYDSLYFIGSGLISGFPLIIFIEGAKRINLSLLGILQYVYPTLIFLTGYFIYEEQLDDAKIVGFIFIWVALFLFTSNGFRLSRLIKKKVFAEQ